MNSGFEQALKVLAAIPEEEYDGGSWTSCLIGYPLWQGQLRDEWEAYMRDDGDALETEWFADRFNLELNSVDELYRGVSAPELCRDKEAALEFAYHTLKEVRSEEDL